MITLYQFRHSAFCLKTRMALHAKKLQYRVEEVTPGIGQFEIFKLSGQKQVPVIVDSNDQVINDSSTICEYIDKKNDNNPLFPEDPILFAQCKLIEDWADTTMATTCRKSLIKSAIENPQLRTALLPEEILEVDNSIKPSICGVQYVASYGSKVGDPSIHAIKTNKYKLKFEFIES